MRLLQRVAVAALILSQHPEYSNEDVRQAIRVSADNPGSPGFDSSIGYGRVNATSALNVTSVLEAKISSPMDGTLVKAPTTISGVARGAGFSRYTLEYGSGNTPSAWTLFQTGVTPVSGGTLGIFDDQVPDGTYTIRLTVFDGANHAFVDRIQLIVHYVSIAGPVPSVVPSTAAVFKPGSPVSITGTAAGTSFLNFQLLWARGINPSSGWSTTGITLTGGGTLPISASSVLGTWDTSSVTQADYYTIRLQVTNPGFTNQVDTLVYLEPDLISANWPKWLASAPSNTGFVPIKDAAGNAWLGGMSSQQNSYPDPLSQFYAFSGDGSLAMGANLSYGGYSQPAAGNFDGSGGEQALMPDYEALRVWRTNGTLNGWTNSFGAHLQDAQIVLADLDGDSRLEAVALGSDSNGNGYIFAWRGDGTQLNSNFPIAIANNGDNPQACPGPRVLVGDIDGDGKKEILAVEVNSGSFNLRLFANDGSPRPWAAPPFELCPMGSIVLADLDHNGKLEIILPVFTSQGTQLHVLQPDGSERPGWPLLLGGFSSAYVAVGDLNRDGHEEIVVSYNTGSNNNYLYVLNPDGTSYSSAWPRVASTTDIFGPVVLADIDGDGYPEIITVQNHSLSNPLPGSSQASYNTPQLLALRRDNTIARSWNLMGWNQYLIEPYSYTNITVGDFNRDGVTDIALLYRVNTGGGQTSGVATVLTTGAPFNASANDWPMFYQNPRNTATLSRRAETWTSLSSSANPSTLGQRVTFTASVALLLAGASTPTGNVNFFDGTANIGSCTLVSGVCSFATSALGAGTHNISATYIGNSSFAAAATADAITQTVNKVTPVISSLSPALVTAGSSAFTLTVNGSNFLTGATVQWNGAARSTTVLSTAQLTAAITAADIASAGTVDVTVVNPAPDGGTSAAFKFAIDSASGGTSGGNAVSVTAESTTLDVVAGQATQIAVSFLGGATITHVTASCLNLPIGVTCSYDESTRRITIQTSATTPAGSYQVLVVFTVTQQTAALFRHRIILASWTALLGLPIGVLWIGGARKQAICRMALVLLGLGLVLSLTTCGGGGGAASNPLPPATITTQTSVAMTLNVH